MNKTTEGKLCTILRYVDYIKISHLNKDVVLSVIDYISSRYCKEAPLTVTRRKIHPYLGMTVDYSTIGKVQIKMSDYIKGILESLSPSMDRESDTPEADHLFTINKDAEIFEP